MKATAHTVTVALLAALLAGCGSPSTVTEVLPPPDPGTSYTVWTDPTTGVGAVIRWVRQGDHWSAGPVLTDGGVWRYHHDSGWRFCRHSDDVCTARPGGPPPAPPSQMRTCCCEHHYRLDQLDRIEQP